MRRVRGYQAAMSRRVVPCAVAASARSAAASSERPAGAIAMPAQQAQNDFRSFRLEGNGAVSGDAERTSDGRRVELVKENRSIFIVYPLVRREKNCTQSAFQAAELLSTTA